ncbi:MAG: glycogen/starch synthase, partial [Pseudomonadota bacterium]
MQKTESILFAASEVFPYLKTGGLADVAGALPEALTALGLDVRIVMPAYDTAMAKASDARLINEFYLSHPNACVEIWQASTESAVTIYFLKIEDYFSRGVNPYLDDNGEPWGDNVFRFAQFSRALARISLDEAGLNWKPNVVHLNDWHTGLCAALLRNESRSPRTIFTIHNLAYQGISNKGEFDYFGFDASHWSPDGMEFHGNWSLMKAGLNYADYLTTVSPTYAKEICTSEQGYGLEGVLKRREHLLFGVLNGIDYDLWDPN